MNLDKTSKSFSYSFYSLNQIILQIVDEWPLKVKSTNFTSNTPLAFHWNNLTPFSLNLQHVSKTNMKLLHLHLYLYEISMNIMRLQIACNLINMFMPCNLESMILTYNITHHFSFTKYVKEYFFLIFKTRYCATARILFLISTDYK